MRSLDVPGLEQDDVVTCRRILARGSKSFHSASLLLPRETRAAASAVYAFCRTADDLIDNGEAGPSTIGGLQRRVDAIYGEETLSDPTDRALRAVTRHWGIPRLVFDTLLEGFAWEVEGRIYETLSDVLAYSVRVAATVGVAMCYLMQRSDHHTLARACDLGVAMQLTNIARDVGQDARAGRVYLPRVWMREAGIDPDVWLRSPGFTPELGSVIERLVLAAKDLYTRAEPGIEMLPPRHRAAIRAAHFIYADIGRLVSDARFDTVSRRVYTSASRKLALTLRALLPRQSGSGSDMHAPSLPEAWPLMPATAQTQHARS